MSETDERPAIPMELQLRVDILDNEGIWNTGKIVDVSRDEEDMVEIKYDGWGEEYNEWIPLSSQRLAPLHMFTMVKKCWAKLTKWPWWPAFVVLRAPTRKSAADALNAESKVYVEFFDSYDEKKRSRCWMQKKNIASFQEGFDERASKNIGKNFPAYVEGTQRAIAGGSPVLFSGNGTLPIEFSSRYAEPLSARKLSLASGDEDKWFEAYRIFSNRYRVLYGYDFAKDSAKSLLAAKRAKGKTAKDVNDDQEEEDDDDDVEIIESSSSRSAKATPPKRGRGRLPTGKHPKKQPPQFADEDDDEEVVDEKEAADDDYEEAGDEEEEEVDEGDDEELESPRGRRSTRVSKRKSMQEDEPRRSTRARRTKEDDDFIAEDDEGEDLTHEESDDDEENQSQNGRASSRSASPEMRQPRTTFNAKAHKRTALSQLMATTQPQPVLKDSKVSHQQKALVSKLLVKEPETAAGVPGLTDTIGDPESSSDVRTKPQRKPTNPQQLSTSPTESAQPVASADASTANHQSSLRHWLGFGAADEGIPPNGSARKPWSIQSWLLNGFRRKQSSESLTNDE